MDRRTFLTASGLLSTVGATAFAGCSTDTRDRATPTAGDTAAGDGTGTNGESSPDDGTPAAGGTTALGSRDVPNTVAMVTDGSEFLFDPIGLFVESGETITFENRSGTHSSTAYREGNGPATTTRIPEGAEAWDSGTLTEQGATFEHTFETPGTYDYFCVPHKTLGMVGRIVVDEPGGPAAGSVPPDGDVPTSQAIVDRGAIPFDEFSG